MSGPIPNIRNDSAGYATESVPENIERARSEKQVPLKKAMEQAPPTPGQFRYCNIAVFGNLGVVWDSCKNEVWIYCVADQRGQDHGNSRTKAFA